MNIALFHKGLIWCGFVKRENKFKNFIILLSWFILLINPFIQSNLLFGKLTLFQTILLFLFTIIFSLICNLIDIHFNIWLILSDYSREIKSSKVFFRTYLNKNSVDNLVSSINTSSNGIRTEKTEFETLSKKIKEIYTKFENIKSGDFEKSVFHLWVDKQEFYSNKISKQISNKFGSIAMFLIYCFYIFLLLTTTRFYYFVPVVALQIVISNKPSEKETVLFLEETVPGFKFHYLEEIYELMLKLRNLVECDISEDNIFIKCIKKVIVKYNPTFEELNHLEKESKINKENKELEKKVNKILG